MGLSDRDYLRDEEARYSGRSPFSAYSVTTILIAVNVALFLADAIFFPDHWLMTTLASDGPKTLFQPWMWWKFLTAGFAHDVSGVRHIIGNMIGLWCFGSMLEQRLERREYLRFYLLAIIAGSIAGAVRQWLFVPEEGWHGAWGASAGVTAVIVLAVCYNPYQMVSIFVATVPLWAVGAIIIGMDVVGALQQARGEVQVGHDAHLAGAALALAYWRFGWNFSAIDPTDWFLNLKRSLTRPKLKVHAPEDERSYASLDAEADRLLAKVGRDGLASLTARERQVLEDYSRRTRQKLR